MRKRGVGIAELVIVLAVLAIISTIVTSFIVMSNEQVRSSNEKVDALNDIAVIESIMEGKIETYISSGYEFVKDDLSTDILFFKDQDNNGARIYFDNIEKELTEIKIVNSVGLQPTVLFECKTIKDITFDIRDNENDEKLFICKVDYTLTKRDYKYTFTIHQINDSNALTYVNVVKGIVETTIDEYFDEYMTVTQDINSLKYVYSTEEDNVNNMTINKFAHLYFKDGKIYKVLEEIIITPEKDIDAYLETADILFENEIIKNVVFSVTEKDGVKTFKCDVTYIVGEVEKTKSFDMTPYNSQKAESNNQGDE